MIFLIMQQITLHHLQLTNKRSNVGNVGSHSEEKIKFTYLLERFT